MSPTAHVSKKDWTPVMEILEHEHEPPRKRRVKVGIGFVVVSAVIILGFLFLPRAQSVRAEGEQLQDQLILAYNSSRSDFRICLEQSRHVSATDTTAKDILMGLVSQFRPKTEVEQDEMTEYITDSLPHLNQASAYQLGSAVVDCRERFISDEEPNNQPNNQRLARELDDWLDTSIPFLGSGLPSDRLVVVGPDGKKLDSSEALRFILEPER